MTYIDEEEIGIGGFGRVLRCVRAADGQPYARKFLNVHDEMSIKRFQREVRILQGLSHRGIIQIIDSHIEKAPYWFIMPLYSNSLRDLIPTLVGDRVAVASFFDELLEAIDYAHKRKVIHRDLKPENILLDGLNRPVISDFGLGRNLDALTSRATGTNSWVGTFAYMAPEQMSDAARSDHRSDIFALGKMLYEMYTGENQLAVMDWAKLPIGFATVIRRCTQTRPEDRFQDIESLRVAFNKVAIPRAEASGENELKNLVALADTWNPLTEHQVHRLCELVRSFENDRKLLFELAMAINRRALEAMEVVDVGAVQILTTEFSRHATETSWDFSFTDSIGDTCKKLFESVSDPNVRRSAVFAALAVGYGHNRFKVIDDGVALIRAINDQSTARELAFLLSEHPQMIENLRQSLGPRDLNSELRELFENTHGDSSSDEW